MEEGSANGKLEETQKKLELHEEEKEVIIEVVEELKPDGVDESLRVDVVDENSGDVEESPKDGNDTSSSSSSSDEESPEYPIDEKSVELVNLEKLDDENEGLDSVVESVEPIVPLSEELIPDTEVIVEDTDVSDVTGLESKEIKEQILQSLDAINEFSAAVTNVVLEEAVERIVSGADGNIGDSSDIVKLASKENEDAAELQLETDINSSRVVDLESKENVDNLLQMPADVPSVDTDKMDERNVEPIISLAPRARHMTSWRSCCGLFDVLRYSNR